MYTGSKIWVLLTLAVILSACGGSSETAEGETKLEEDFPTAEATTDQVPVEQAATPEQPADAVAAAPLDTPTETPPPEHTGTGSSTYVVKSGDTLMKIAYENYGNLFEWRRIYSANQGTISNPMSLKAGTVLQLDVSSPAHIERNGTPYLIKQGDTLGLISDDVYGTNRKWRKLWENNRQMIRNPNRIYAGFYLYYVVTPEDEAEKLRIRTPAQMGGGTATSATPLVTPQAGAANGG